MKIGNMTQSVYKKIDNVYLWNTLAGLVNAAQAFVFMFVITRACGLSEAGIFSFAFANANVFLCIGRYGMRKFQATDIKQEYTFADYFWSRVVTTSLMFGAIVIYAFSRYEDYSIYKFVIVLLIGLLKMIDSFDDLFLGMFQQRNHLEIGAKNACIRNFIMLSVSIFVLIITENMFWGLVVAFVISLILLILLFRKSVPNEIMYEQWEIKWDKVKKLLLINIPLVVGDFLTMYIINAPKYAIDARLSEEKQAIYGILSQPVWVIALFSDFIFNPVLVRFSQCWLVHDKKVFFKLLSRQFILISIFTVVVLFGGYFWGLPVLGIIYAVDISIYRAELMLLLLGGGLTAVYSFLYSLTVCIRKQRCIIPIFGMVGVIVVLSSNILIEKIGLLGAVLLYFGSASILAIIFCIVVLTNIYKGRDVKGGN